MNKSVVSLYCGVLFCHCWSEMTSQSSTQRYSGSKSLRRIEKRHIAIYLNHHPQMPMIVKHLFAQNVMRIIQILANLW
ncbi:hypothetical protein [Klebsiella pneumoniae]|uniref:hypothetical protein n=1 Tax=Klebsiella pneumoniae TaxID=573 RepID=UPI00114D4942|nr:hypothetical protein [Klebsiella pneumoniae]